MKTLSEQGTLIRGRVVGWGKDGLLVEAEDGRIEPCDVAEDAEAGSNEWEPGDRVLVWRQENSAVRSRVIEVLARKTSTRGGEDPAEERRIVARTVVIEAGSRLELRVGDSRIVIAEDGRIEIHGKNVLSRAKGVNKIRGAAIALN